MENNTNNTNNLPAAARLAAYGIEPLERLPHGMLYLEGSTQAKTGDIPQTYASRTSCPVDCPMRSGCYAAAGRCRLVIRRCDADSDKKQVASWMRLAAKVDASRAAGRDLIRHGVGGDIAASGSNLIDAHYLRGLTAAYAGLAYGYTHCVQCERNDQLLREAAAAGFILSYSCETEAGADSAVASGIPAVLVWPKGVPVPGHTADGNMLVQCPQQTRNVQCKDCRLCARKERRAIIVFAAHGAHRVVARALDAAAKTPRRVIPIAPAEARGPRVRLGDID